MFLLLQTGEGHDSTHIYSSFSKVHGAVLEYIETQGWSFDRIQPFNKDSIAWSRGDREFIWIIPLINWQPTVGLGW